MRRKAPAKTRSADAKQVVGWREWVALPDLGIKAIKVKIDTGARSSALHAYDVDIYRRSDGRDMVRFKVHPLQRNTRKTVAAEHELVDQRWVRSSQGHETLRPVIVTTIEFDGRSWPIELTLVNRDSLGFRMLLGREALRGRLVIDPGKSYVAGKRALSVRRKKKQ